MIGKPISLLAMREILAVCGLMRIADVTLEPAGYRIRLAFIRARLFVPSSRGSALEAERDGCTPKGRALISRVSALCQAGYILELLNLEDTPQKHLRLRD